MELKHIDITRLSVSSLNMRGTKKTCDIANILPSVRARGVLVPLIVREMDRSGSEIADGSPDMAGPGRGKDALHYSCVTMAERLQQKLQWLAS